MQTSESVRVPRSRREITGVKKDEKKRCSDGYLLGPLRAHDFNLVCYFSLWQSEIPRRGFSSYDRGPDPDSPGKYPFFSDDKTKGKSLRRNLSTPHP